MQRQVLITGAGGFLGRHLTRHLASAGWRVRAMVRRDAAGADVVTADLLVPQSLDAAVAGQQAIVHLAAAADTSRPATNRAVNVEGTRHLLQACARQGGARPRILFFSTQCVDRPLQDAYARTKREAERLLDGWPHVVFRPTMIYGEGSKEFSTFVGAIKRLPLVPIIGSGRARIRPVFVDDVLPAVHEALLREPALGGTYAICGPEPIGFDALVQQVAGALLGRRRRICHVPGRAALLGARLLGALLPRPPITVDQVLGFLQDTLADPGPARDALGFSPRPVADGLAALFTRAPASMW